MLFREVGGGGDGQESLGGSAAVRKGDEPTGHAVGGIEGPAGDGDVLELQGVVTGEEGERVDEASGAAGHTDGGTAGSIARQGADDVRFTAAFSENGKRRENVDTQGAFPYLKLYVSEKRTLDQRVFC